MWNINYLKFSENLILKGCLSLIFCMSVFLINAQSIEIKPGKIEVKNTPTYPGRGMKTLIKSASAINAIQWPTEGTIIYDSTFKKLRIFNGQRWVILKNSGIALPGLF